MITSTCSVLFHHNKNIIEHNTLRIPAIARYYCTLSKEEDMQEIQAFAEKKGLPIVPLGAGSNTVFNHYINAVVVHILLHKRTIKRSKKGAQITLGAGCGWHHTVIWSLHLKLYGLENLSLIPGTVGAAPIQNIGAYGVEIERFIVAVRGYSITLEKFINLTPSECSFGYRHSIFKQALQGNFIITSVVLHLKDTFVPILEYAELKQRLRNKYGTVHQVTPMQVSQMVCMIRRNKLPDPTTLPNVGSFFKNPVVDERKFSYMYTTYPHMPFYKQYNGYKIAAAWLIQQCGLKGYRQERVGIYKEQALIIVNYGGATGEEIIDFATMVQNKVWDTFEIALDIEPYVYKDHKVEEL